MDAVDAPPPPPSGPSEMADATGSPGALRFVVVFVLVVLGLLTGYRYAIDTLANDWYLFQVAKHTSWVLGLVGYRADLEGPAASGRDPNTVRAALRGEDAPPPASLEPGETAPLSAWEKWRDRSLRARENGTQTREVGPHVLFVLEPGHRHKIEALEAQLQKGPADGGATAGLQTRIRTLQEELSTGRGNPEKRRMLHGTFFNFIVVPECGAIEVMAIFLAAVVAFPAGWRARIWGLLAGLPILYVVNVLRLSCLAYIGAVDTGGEWFEFCHEYVWQAVYVVFVVMLWMAWVEFRVRRAAA